MSWLIENWFWVLIGIVFVATHLFGHGSHGGHGRNHAADHDIKGAESGDREAGHRH